LSDWGDFPELICSARTSSPGGNLKPSLPVLKFPALSLSSLSWGTFEVEGKVEI
jgi:hypothetical protein